MKKKKTRKTDEREKKRKNNLVCFIMVTYLINVWLVTVIEIEGQDVT